MSFNSLLTALFNGVFLSWVLSFGPTGSRWQKTHSDSTEFWGKEALARWAHSFFFFSHGLTHKYVAHDLFTHMLLNWKVLPIMVDYGPDLINLVADLALCFANRYLQVKCYRMTWRGFSKIRMLIYLKDYHLTDWKTTIPNVIRSFVTELMMARSSTSISGFPAVSLKIEIFPLSAALTCVNL